MNDKPFTDECRPKIIYNPSDISVWASDKDGIFCIKSGEVCFR